MFRKFKFFAQSFEEQKDIVREFWGDVAVILEEQDFSSEFKVELASLPVEFTKAKKNFFSVLFIAVLKILNLDEEKCRLYSYINHLFRVWVTSADNLLDDEDKVTIPLVMPNDSRVMRQVVAIMLADRILSKKLHSAFVDGIINSEELERISDSTLKVLLPAAAEEGMEEGGISSWPTPDEVLENIHPIKTGILFHIPFMGPELIEKDIDLELLHSLKDSLMDFGLACQLLDDIKDFSLDFNERRVNYLISLILSSGTYNEDEIATTLSLGINFPAGEFPHELDILVAKSMELFTSSLQVLDRVGVNGVYRMRKLIVRMLIKQLNVSEIKNKALKLL